MPYRNMNTSNLPWWQLLPDGEIKEKLHFDTDLWNKVLMNTVSISDFAVRTTAATAMVMASQQHIDEIKSVENIARWRFYCNERLFKKPNLFFKKPPKKVEIISMRAHMPEFSDATVEDFSFVSPFKYVSPDYKPIVDHGALPKSYARSIRHGDNSRPTIICIHGFLFDDFALNSFLFGARKYFDMGFDLLLYTLPFHGPRKVKGASYNGDGFFILDPSTINENVALSIYDLQIFIGHIKKHSREKLGISGISLGGYHAALAASLDKRIDFAIAKIPMVSMWDLILSWQPASLFVKVLSEQLGFNAKEMRHFMAIHSPLSHKPKLAPENLFMVGAIGDQMVSTHHTQMLWHHWREPEIFWYPGTHIVHLNRDDYLEAIAKFLKRQIS